MWLLAQTPTPDDVGKSVDIIERVSRGSVAFILLCLLVLAIVCIYWLLRRASKAADRREEEDEKRNVRERDGYQKALADVKTDAEKVRTEMLAIAREKTQSEREMDATIASAVRAIDRCATIIERAERIMDRLERNHHRGGS
jgi:Na+-transporting methylmalonyl-CoA/oxaloacetate decarboxylase gamma subunit